MSPIEDEELIPILDCILDVAFIEVEECLCVESEVLHEDGSCVVD